MIVWARYVKEEVFSKVILFLPAAVYSCADAPVIDSEEGKCRLPNEEGRV